MNRSDAFTYSADPITGGTPTDGGSAWVTPGSSYGTNGSLMYFNSGTGALLDCGATDHEVGFTVVTLVAVGVGGRSTGGTATGYLYHFTAGGSGTLYELPGFDVLDTGGTIVAGDDIAVRCVGTSVKGYVNGVEQVSATDATHSTGTYGMVYAGNTMDDFYITDLTAGGNRRRRALLCGGP
jgi:hypothetical protein